MDSQEIKAIVDALTPSIQAVLDERNDELAKSLDERDNELLEQLDKKLAEKTSEYDKKIDEAVTRYSIPDADEPDKKTGGKKFSLARAARAIAARDWSGAGYEREVFDELRKREMSAGTDSAGGYIVPDEQMSELIELLRPNVVALELGARELPNLSGSPVSFPKHTGGISGAWVNENATIGAEDNTLGQIQLTPKTVASRVVLSNLLIEISTPGADAIVREDLARGLGQALDLGLLTGSGAAGEPIGVCNTIGVNTYDLDTPTWAKLVNAIHTLAEDNALMGSLGWAMHPDVLRDLRIIPDDDSTFTVAVLPEVVL